MARMFEDRPITKETIALGIGGTIDAEGVSFPPRARVKFEAWASFANVKHVFTEKGTVHEMLVLTVDAASFEVLAVEEQPVQEELPAEEAAP